MLLLVALAACGGDDGPPADRGPTTIAVGADPNGIYWDASENKLFVTDDASNSILMWDGEGTSTFSRFAGLTAAPASGVSLGELTRTASKVFYTPRFGFGVAGTVVAVDGAKAASNLSGLQASRRRVGITVTAAGETLVSWFIGGGGAPQVGSVSLLTVSASGAASERELVTGLKKVVGVAVTGRTLYVTDQTDNTVLAFSLDAVLATPQVASQGRVVATITSTGLNLDLMTAAADGTLFVGGRAGTLYRVSPAGVVSTLASGLRQIRGVSYDAANRRLFVVEHSTNIATAPNSIRIIPVD